MTCDTRLQRLFAEVIKHADHAVICGHRGQVEQDEAYHLGLSQKQWPHSTHNPSPSRAVDVAPYPIDWHDIQRFRELAVIVKECASRLGISVHWGGDYVTWKDYVHWELAE